MFRESTTEVEYDFLQTLGMIFIACIIVFFVIGIPVISNNINTKNYIYTTDNDLGTSLECYAAKDNNYCKVNDEFIEVKMFKEE